MPLHKLMDSLYLCQDSCNVYVIKSGESAVLVDFGSGDVLDGLEAIGIMRVTDVLMTHHHRDQAQGLERAIAAGARVWVPHTEQALFDQVDSHWQARELYNNYNMRQDRFSLLEPVPFTGTLRDYAAYDFGDHRYTVIPTPGHTTGSLSLLVEIEGQRVAFTGDLIAAPGKVWSLAATQWSYNGAEGVAATIASLLDLKEREPAMLLPSHGDPMSQPVAAMELLVDRLWTLLRARQQYLRLFIHREQPYVALTPHLLFNRTSLANAYVLLSDSGKALFIDYGYDFVTGVPAGSDRASRRPWLYTLPMLKQQFGVQKIDVVIPTHYHDDHVAGLNLLRDAEETEVWVAENFSDLLEHPSRYDLPCLWYDPIPVDRVLPLGEPFQWEEYELTCYEQPGHTLYAIALAFKVDEKQVLAIGDQHQAGELWNYVYQNGFEMGDYRRSAALYREVQPDLILSGHAEPLEVTPSYLDVLADRGELLEQLHQRLLPLESVDVGTGGVGARIRPYQSEARGGEEVTFSVEVRNPFASDADALVTFVVPSGWQVDRPSEMISIAAHGSAHLSFRATPPTGARVRRARVAVDLTIGGHRLGQQAEALVSVTPA